MLKATFCALSAWSGLNRLARFLRRRDLLTLCYHNVQPEREVAPSPLLRNTISMATLREHLEAVRRWFHVVTPQQVLLASRGAPLPPRAALLTFDDGYASWVDHAMPLLHGMGLPALFFVATDAMQTQEPLWYEELNWMVCGWQDDVLPWPDGSERACPASQTDAAVALLQDLKLECRRLAHVALCRYVERLRAGRWQKPPVHERQALAPLTWDGVRLLHRSGFAVGSHTASHPHLSRTDAATLDHELASSRRRIEGELGAPCPWIAYPYGGPGDVSPAVFAQARAAGYELGFTTGRAFDQPAREPLAIGRACVPANLTGRALHAFLSGVFA
jgi:peptidoglycan/xylan/chitin deacetylase (PgdA/CDA1 family)